MLMAAARVNDLVFGGPLWARIYNLILDGRAHLDAIECGFPAPSSLWLMHVARLMISTKRSECRISKSLLPLRYLLVYYAFCRGTNESTRAIALKWVFLVQNFRKRSWGVDFQLGRRL